MAIGMLMKKEDISDPIPSFWLVPFRRIQANSDHKYPLGSAGTVLGPRTFRDPELL